MDDPIPKTLPTEIPHAGSSKRLPQLFVGEGEQRTAVIAADELPARNPEEVRKARDLRRRAQEAERLREEADMAASFRRIRNAVLTVVLAGGALWGAWALNQRWHGDWPIIFTWMVMATAMLGGFGWLIWYMEKGD